MGGGVREGFQLSAQKCPTKIKKKMNKCTDNMWASQNVAKINVLRMQRVVSNTMKSIHGKEREEPWALPGCPAEMMGKPSPGLLTKD